MAQTSHDKGSKQLKICGLVWATVFGLGAIILYVIGLLSESVFCFLLAFALIGGFLIVRHGQVSKISGGLRGFNVNLDPEENRSMRAFSLSIIQKANGSKIKKIPSLELHTATCKWVTLLTYYSVVKAYQSKQPIRSYKIAEILYADQHPPGSSGALAAQHIVLGIILGLSGFLPPDSMIVEQTQITIQELPNDFVEYMPDVLQKCIDECEGHYKSRLQSFRDKIDQYFES